MSRKQWLVLCILTLVSSLAAVQIALADGPITNSTERAEIRFLEGMVNHRQVTADMAGNCLTKAKTEAVRKLCQTVLSVQTTQIKLMRGWLLAWYQIDFGIRPNGAISMPMMQGNSMGGMNNNDHSSSKCDDSGMMSMMMQMMQGNQMGMGNSGSDTSTAEALPMMAGLSSLTGYQYEIAWLEAMIEDHEGAVDLSSHLLTRAGHRELRDLAQKIIDDETAEIKIMRGMITALAAM